MKTILNITGRYSLLLICGLGLSFAIGSKHAGARKVSATSDGIMVQIDPETEQTDQVAEPVGGISEEPEVEPTEPLDAVSETDDQASEQVGDNIAPTESLDEDSMKTVDQATEVIPPGPSGEEYPLQNQTPPQKKMPLSDIEAEGR